MHFDEYENSPYLVLPYCANGSVFNMIGQCNESTLAIFTLHAASALDYLHNQDQQSFTRILNPTISLLVTMETS